MNEFGIDLNRLNQMTDEEISNYAREISEREIEKSRKHQLKSRNGRQTVQQKSTVQGGAPFESLSHLMNIEAGQSTVFIERSEFETKLANNGLEIQPTVADGDCMFHALSLQLERCGVTKKSRAQIRKDVVVFMRNNKKLINGTYLPDFVHTHRGNWNTFIDGMSNKDWGDHVVLAITSQIYNVGILVYSTMNNEPIYISVVQKKDIPILLLGHYSEVHYVSITPKRQQIRSNTSHQRPVADPAAWSNESSNDYYGDNYDENRSSAEFQSGNAPMPIPVDRFSEPARNQTKPETKPFNNRKQEFVMQDNDRIDDALKQCRTLIKRLKSSENVLKDIEEHKGIITINRQTLNMFRKNHEYSLHLLDGKRSSNVGKGRFSNVYSIKIKHIPENIYCLKRIRIKKLEQQKDNILNSLLMQINLSHKNILKILGLFSEQWLENGDSFNIYLEYANEGTLHDLIRKAKARHCGLAMQDAYVILKQLLEGLAYLQEFRIVHRNFSENNILINRNQNGQIRPLISGFGAARIITNDDGLNPLTLRREGNECYFAPERYRNELYDESSDIWCLAVMFYRMLIGRFPPAFLVPEDIAYRVAYEDTQIVECILEALSKIPDNLKDIFIQTGENILEGLLRDMTFWAPKILDSELKSPSDEHQHSSAKSCYLKRPKANIILDKYADILNDTFISKIPSTPLVQGEQFSLSSEYTQASKSSITERLGLPAYVRKVNPGVAVIINNMEFDKIESNEKKGDKEKVDYNRPSSKYDREALKKFFENNNYDLEGLCRDNLKGGEIDEFLDEVARDYVKSEHTIFVCCILSHGKCLSVAGTDWDCIDIGDITKKFSSEKCPQLKGIPKVFIIQACQKISSNQNEFGMAKLIPEGEDFLLAMSTMFGMAAFREPGYGSYFIQELCRNLETDEDFTKVCYRTNGRLSKIMEDFQELKKKSEDDTYSDVNFNQTPGIITTVVKSVYLRSKPTE